MKNDIPEQKVGRFAVDARICTKRPLVIAHAFQEAGYATISAGKKHLGA